MRGLSEGEVDDPSFPFACEAALDKDHEIVDRGADQRGFGYLDYAWHGLSGIYALYA